MVLYLTDSETKYLASHELVPRDEESPTKPYFDLSWIIFIICLGIMGSFMAFMTVLSAFKYQFIKIIKAEKQHQKPGDFYGVKFEAVKQHDMTTDDYANDQRCVS